MSEKSDEKEGRRVPTSQSEGYLPARVKKKREEYLTTRVEKKT
jgi:hypothetical protein